MELKVVGTVAVIATIVITALVVLAIKSGKFGNTAKKSTDLGDKVVEKVSTTVKKVTGK